MFSISSLRIHKDKSFHCEVCNVCLDIRFEGKHKCRPDSGHDECCICLEVSGHCIITSRHRKLIFWRTQLTLSSHAKLALSRSCFPAKRISGFPGIQSSHLVVLRGSHLLDTLLCFPAAILVFSRQRYRLSHTLLLRYLARDSRVSLTH